MNDFEKLKWEYEVLMNNKLTLGLKRIDLEYGDQRRLEEVRKRLDLFMPVPKEIGIESIKPRTGAVVTEVPF